MAFSGPKLVGVKWTGLDTFKQELQVLATGLATEANGILTESAEAAKTAIAAAYPLQTGALRAGLVLRPARGLVLTGLELLQTAPHGYLYEHGTRPRETKSGANRGLMTGNPTFIPIAAAYRRTALTHIIDRLYWHGAARVTGDAERAA